MHNYKNKRLSNNDLFFTKYKTIQRSKTSIEEQDNESLNTMDYYKEEKASKENIFESNTYSSNKKDIPASDFNSKIDIDPQILANFRNTCIENNLGGGLYDEITFARNTTLYQNKKKMEKNIEKRFKTIFDNCSKCDSKINYSTKTCSNCSKPLCKNCLKQIFPRNLDNNNDSEIFTRNINEKNCPNCRKSKAIRYDPNQLLKKQNSPSLNKWPIDIEHERTSSSSNNQYSEKDYLVKGLNDQSNEYNLFLKKIEEKKKEIEIKKKLNVNIIQMLQRSVEYEYNFNLNKLNQMILKIKKVQEMIADKLNRLNQQKSFRDNSDLQNIVKKFKDALGVFLKKFEKIEQKINLKSKSMAYKSYESKPLLVNLADTYCMKDKELLSNNNIGNAFFRVDRYVNGFVNCLSFSVSIKQDKKIIPINNNNNSTNKPKYVVNLIVDNKIIKLTKVNKDKDSSCLDYECSLEESQVFNTKIQSNGLNNYIKKDDFSVKLIITELIL